MPNWCENQVSVSGDKEQIKARVPKHALYDGEFNLVNAKNKAETEMLMKKNNVLENPNNLLKKDLIEESNLRKDPWMRQINRNISNLKSNIFDFKYSTPSCI